MAFNPPFKTCLVPLPTAPQAAVLSGAVLSSLALIDEEGKDADLSAAAMAPFLSPGGTHLLCSLLRR